MGSDSHWDGDWDDKIPFIDCRSSMLGGMFAVATEDGDRLGFYQRCAGG